MRDEDTIRTERADVPEEPVQRERATQTEDTEAGQRADVEEEPASNERAVTNEDVEPSERADPAEEPVGTERAAIPTGEIIWAPVPQPLPYRWRVGTTPSGHVIQEVETILGTLTFLYDPADARQLGSAFIRHGQDADAVRQSKAPLVVTDKMPSGPPPGR